MAKRTAAGRARTVAHHHKHVKAAHAHAKGATGHAHKHHKAAKHHAKPHKHKGTVHRGLAIGDAVACCAAEALAASLRLSGLPVTDADVLDLFWRAGGDPDAGTPILATLEAASESGLAAVRPASFADVLDECEPFLRGGFGDCGPAGVGDDRQLYGGPVHPASLILGVDLPGPHAVLATPDGWWSWGGLWCPCEFPDAVIEEAWEVTWQ